MRKRLTKAIQSNTGIIVRKIDTVMVHFLQMACKHSDATLVGYVEGKEL